MNIVISLIVIAVGVMMVIKTMWIYDFTGPIAWAETHLGTEGGTRLLIKMIGVVMIFGAFLSVTGLLGPMIRGIFGSFLNI